MANRTGTDVSAHPHTARNTQTDEAILVHIRPLARLTQAHLTLDSRGGWIPRRNQPALRRVRRNARDRAYLDRRESELRADGFNVESILPRGIPRGSPGGRERGNVI